MCGICIEVPFQGTKCWYPHAPGAARGYGESDPLGRNRTEQPNPAWKADVTVANGNAAGILTLTADQAALAAALHLKSEKDAT